MMPRYFFSVEGPTENSVDEEGEEFSDDLAARRAAVEIAGELIGTFVNANVVVRARDGRVVAAVPIGKMLN
jgi:hypothetical protein